MKRSDIWKKYKKIEILGSGAFANVYKAKCGDEYFAIKEIPKIKSDKNKLLREIEDMEKMEYDNIVKYKESVETKDSFYIVSELCHFTLAEYLNMRKKTL